MRHSIRGRVGRVWTKDPQVAGVLAELHSLDLDADHVVLLCSDGLAEMVPDDQIAAILEAENQPQGDNVTAVVAHVQLGAP